MWKKSAFKCAQDILYFQDTERFGIFKKKQGKTRKMFILKLMHIELKRHTLKK